MNAYLAGELRNYYRLQGKKIIFRNGMNLNQLALEIWQWSGFEGIDPSSLSRILKGERLFTKKQLEIFSKLNKLKRLEKLKLDQALSLDINKRYNLDDSLLNSNKFVIDLFSQLISKTRQLELENQLIYADSLAALISESIEKRLKITANQADRVKLLKLWADLLYEKYYCSLMTQTKSRNWGSLFKLSYRLLEIGQELKNSEIVGTANYQIGDIYYVMCQHEKATKFLQTALDLLPQNLKRIYAIRALIISYANMKDVQLHQKIKLEMTNSLPEDGNLRSIYYEALGRSSALLGQSDQAINFLDLAQKNIANIKDEAQTVRRKVQIIVAEVVLGYSLDRNDTTLVKNARKGLELANLYGNKLQAEGLNELIKYGTFKIYRNI